MVAKKEEDKNITDRQTDRGDREEKETGIPFKGIATMAYFLQPDPTR